MRRADTLMIERILCIYPLEAISRLMHQIAPRKAFPYVKPEQ